MDTTGSMRNEIEATRNVILQFMEAQTNTTECYMLVPFNDYVDYHHLYTEIPPGKFMKHTYCSTAIIKAWHVLTVLTSVNCPESIVMDFFVLF